MVHALKVYYSFFAGVIAQTAKQVYAKTLSMVGHVTTAQDRKHGSLDVINLILPCRNDLTHIQAELTYLLGELEQDTYDFMRPRYDLDTYRWLYFFLLRFCKVSKIKVAVNHSIIVPDNFGFLYKTKNRNTNNQ